MFSKSKINEPGPKQAGSATDKPETAADAAKAQAEAAKAAHEAIDAAADEAQSEADAAMVRALDRSVGRINTALQEEGIAVPSGTTLNGRYVLHVANTNHRSRREDFDLLVREVIRLGQRYAAEHRE
mgnify:CR=1 FL=1